MSKKTRSWSRSKNKKQGEDGEALAKHLVHQLNRLVAIRNCAARLMARDQLGRDFFARGETAFVSFATKADQQKDLVVAYERVVNRKRTPVCATTQDVPLVEATQGELPLFEDNEKARR